MAMTQKSFATGSTYPPLADGVLRVYSMRFCPFAQRTRLVLQHKKIPHETVNVDLKKKPEWFLERNPFGLVPTLEQGDKIVYESNICNVYLDEAYPGEKLISTDPYQKARDQILIDTFGKVTAAHFKLLRNIDGPDEFVKELKRYEEALKQRGNYFGGNKPNMVDFTVWPWFERFQLLEMVDFKLDAANFPLILAYINRMYELPAVKATMFDKESHLTFVKSYQAGEPNYDFGL
ncbi:hypothetical protein LOTGIDRAFT_191561 [Lottia gigantea]|uniref:Glutathione S-transferase omega n=1 Tax=Lottia gigantea TaxID=225164 RepID=V4A7R5_LOTGI|nr:hypothetical protein LOTGIDRAFT_191561 [Lottia gigantea]ESO91070.1 hypothetical protein LOTGIDRAFT_191561 [Lottia gigantea]